MKATAFLVATLLVVWSPHAQADANPTQQSPTTSCDEIKTAKLIPSATPLRLDKGTKLIVTETDEVTVDGEHNLAVITAEHTITSASKTEIRFDTRNILKSSSNGYYGRRGDVRHQYIPVGDPPVLGESGEPTDIYVETPIFNGTVHVLARHDRAAGEMWRWVSTDPVELELELGNGSRVKLRGDYVKSLILFNGIKSVEEGFALSDFSFMPVWMRDTSERPGKTEEIIQVLTGVEQPTVPLRIARGSKFIIASRHDADAKGVHHAAGMTTEVTITRKVQNTLRYDMHTMRNSSTEDFELPMDEKGREFTPYRPSRFMKDWLSDEEIEDIDVDTEIFKGRLSVVHKHDRDGDTWTSQYPAEINFPLSDGSRVKVRAIYTKEAIGWTAADMVYTEGFELQDFRVVPLWMRVWGCNHESTLVLARVEHSGGTTPHH